MYLVPLKQYVPDIGDDLRRVIEKAMQSNPEQRFQSAQEMMRALQKIVQLESKKIIRALGNVKSKKNADLGAAFRIYMEFAWERYSMVKTLLYRDEPRFLYEVYEHPSVKLKDNVLDTRRLIDIMKISHFLIVSSQSGTGKSMLMRHFFIDALRNDQFYIPIFVELRNLRSERSLMDVMFHSVSSMGCSLDQQDFEHALVRGRFILLLDGFDEVESNLWEDVYREINELCDKNSNNYFIISSRPCDIFVQWQQFSLLELLPFNKQQALNLIGRLDYDAEVKDRFLRALDIQLFDAHASFASNPLLLTIMLLTFQQYIFVEIPSKLHLFCDMAFDTLYRRHDASKGFKRLLECNLSQDSFRSILSELCFRTYADQKTTFTRQELREYINKIKRLDGTPPDSFIDDLRVSICLLIQVGYEEYQFSHRSFQEFFTACFLRDAIDEIMQKVGLWLLRQNPFMVCDDDVFRMLFDMNRTRFLRNIALPFLLADAPKIEGFEMHPDCMDYFRSINVFADELDVLIDEGIESDMPRKRGSEVDIDSHDAYVDIEQGWELVRQHYAQLRRGKSSDEDDMPFTATELKVMVIGAGSSGKSSLSKAIAQEEHDPNEPSTKGITLKNIRPFTLDGQDWTLRIWDFGGQEAYAATQTMFMANNTLYLVVADGRTEVPPDPYLAYIKTFAPNSPVILVINKMDENDRADLNRQNYIDEYDNLHPEMVRFSCVEPYRDDCLETLRKRMEEVLKSPNGQPLIKQWSNRGHLVRSDLVTLLNQRGTYVFAKEYYALCKKRGLTEESGDIIRNICNESGIIFSIKDRESGIDLILHPVWVTEGINRICRLPEKGWYSRGEINEYMSEYGYETEAVRYILDILCMKKLAFTTPQNSMGYFIPALLPGKEPDGFLQRYANWPMSKQGDINHREIHYRYCFLHPVIKQTFLVRLCCNGIFPQAYRFSAYWENNGVHILMREKVNDITFYLSSSDSGVLCEEQKFVQRLMEGAHEEWNIVGQLHFAFRVVEDGTILTAEYSYDDLLTLKEQMKVDELPLPGLRRVLSVDEILTGFRNTSNERESEMGKTTTIVHGNQINVHDSPGAVTAGEKLEGTVTTTVGSTPEQTLFSEQTKEAISIIEKMKGLDAAKKAKLIAYLNEANEATLKGDDAAKKSCKERFEAFAAGAGKAINKALKALSDFATIVSFFGPLIAK